MRSFFFPTQFGNGTNFFLDEKHQMDGTRLQEALRNLCVGTEWQMTFHMDKGQDIY